MNAAHILNRLNFQPAVQKFINFRGITTNSKLFIQATPCLMAEPLKKKKRIDPAVIKQREDRKKKRIEKQIRRLEKNARQLKPIEECEIPAALIDDPGKRQRNLPPLAEEVKRQRLLLQKEWANYKREQHLKTVQMMDRISFEQQRALDELHKESEELYNEAIQFDYHLLPFKSEGPRETPPIENYEVPDGDYQDVSKKWEN